MNKLFYLLDKLLVKYPSFKLWLLASISFISILFGAILLSISNGDLLQSFWISWSYLIDPGLHLDVEEVYARVISIAIAIVGMLIFALLIGLISESINEKFSQLKSGKTNVFEENHFVILGWSEKIRTLLPQITLGLKNQDSNIVIMSDKDKEFMEEYLISSEYNIICRTGDIDDEFYLDKINIKQAKYILLLINPNIQFNDEMNFKVLLVLIKSLKIINIPITVEIENEKNKYLFESLTQETSNLNLIYTKEPIARLLAQSAINTGITKVYDQLFDFNGESFKLIEDASLENKSLFDISRMSNNTLVCGIYSYKYKTLILDSEYLYQQNDKLLLLCNSYENIVFSQKEDFINYKINILKDRDLELLIIGYNETVDIILKELDQVTSYKILIVSNNGFRLKENYKFLNVSTTNDYSLNEVSANSFDKILIVAEDISQTILCKDSDVLSKLITLRLRNPNTTIISEISDSKTMKLVSKINTNDFVISNQLISKFLTTISFSNEINIIVDDLLSSGGNLIKIVQLQLDDSRYADIYYSLLMNNIILLGYIHNNEIIFNPFNDQIVAKNDSLIIIQNDD